MSCVSSLSPSFLSIPFSLFSIIISSSCFLCLFAFFHLQLCCCLSHLPCLSTNSLCASVSAPLPLYFSLFLNWSVSTSLTVSLSVSPVLASLTLLVLSPSPYPSVPVCLSLSLSLPDYDSMPASLCLHFFLSTLLSCPISASLSPGPCLSPQSPPRLCLSSPSCLYLAFSLTLPLSQTLPLSLSPSPPLSLHPSHSVHSSPSLPPVYKHRHWRGITSQL